jgi:protein SCO1/2
MPDSVSREQQRKPEVGIVEKLGDVLPLDVELVDDKGYLVPLKDVVRKPAIFTFVYYRCPSICSPLLSEVARVVETMDLTLGQDYQIVTISFDHREGTDVAASKRDSYLSSLRTPVNPAGWRFYTADSVTAARLTDAAGFYYKRDGNDFAHAAALIIVSPEGKVTRYINGIQYLPFDVKMALLDAGEGRTGPTIARLVRYCYSYDPEGRTYTLNVTRIAGVVVLGLALLFALVYLIIPKKKTRQT